VRNLQQHLRREVSIKPTFAFLLHNPKSVCSAAGNSRG
jgi:hypothetical protein